jgi:hypothetical protein
VVDLAGLVTTSHLEQLALAPGTPVVGSFGATGTRGIPAKGPEDAD